MAKTNINHRAPIPRPISGPNKQKKKSQNYVHIKAINVASVLIEQADFEQDLRSHTFAAGETTGVWSTNNGQGGQAARHKGVQVI